MPEGEVNPERPAPIRRCAALTGPPRWLALTLYLFIASNSMVFWLEAYSGFAWNMASLRPRAIRLGEK